MSDAIWVVEVQGPKDPPDYWVNVGTHQTREQARWHARLKSINSDLVYRVRKYVPAKEGR